MTALGRAVWLADVTGTGRQQWRVYFAEASQRTPYTRVRIQAAIARRDPARPAGAVVHLVWAGADAAGTYLDNRNATLHVTRQGATWKPVR